MTLDGGDYVEYIYDGKYQLTSEARSGGTSYTRAFYYDPAGNRTRLVKNGPVTGTYAYDTADKLTKETEGETETAYLYDANGSLTRKTQGETVEAYGYNYHNLMTSYDGPGTENDTTYTYDLDLKRIRKVVGGSTTTKFIYDEANVIAEYDVNNALQASYITPGLDRNLTIKRSGSTYYYHQDGLGSIRNITDASENIQNTYNYYAFGSVVGSPTENVTNDYRFTGRRWDSESSLYYYRARMYAPTYGSFFARDPGKQPTGNSLYVYVENNPLDYIDPFGEDKCRLWREWDGKSRHTGWKVVQRLHGPSWRFVSATRDPGCDPHFPSPNPSGFCVIWCKWKRLEHKVYRREWYHYHYKRYLCIVEQRPCDTRPPGARPLAYFRDKITLVRERAEYYIGSKWGTKTTWFAAPGYGIGWDTEVDCRYFAPPP